MRTKTLILTAALGLASTAATMAQVYSVNAVGYVNVTLKKGFNLISNPLDAGAGNNTAEKLFASVPDGTIIYKYDPSSGYSINAFDAAFGWDNGAQTLVPGEGAWLRVPSDATVTFVGEVMQGNLKNPLPKGFGLASSQVPQAGKITTDLKYPAEDGDFVYTFDNAAGYSIFGYDFGAWDTEPTIDVGQAFWSRKGAAGSWDRTFSVN